MAKISQLPALNNPDGNELVPVVKNGETMRASVAGLVAGAVAGTVDNLKVDAVAYIGRPGDVALVDGTPTGIGAIFWHDTVDDAGIVTAVDVFDRAAGKINLAVYRGPRNALVRVALTSFKTIGTRTSRRIALAESIAVRAGDMLAVQPTAGALVVAEVQSGDVGYTYSAPYLPETIALDAPTTNGQVQVRFVIAYRKQIVTADTFLASTAVKIVGPRAVALSSDANPRGYVEWTTTGQPTGHLVKWGNYTATLDDKAQRMEFPNFALTQPYAFIGNSLTDSTDTKDRWSQVLAARYGQLMISVARYSSDWRMVYRVGAKAIVLTLAGALPAAGTVAVSKINGAAIDGNNPAAFLTTGDPGVVSGMAMSGYLMRNGVTRRATVSAPNGASFAYVVTQAPGQTAITFDGPVTFVPDFALSVPGRICPIWLGNNYFFSGVANAYGDNTNPQMWVDLKLIVAFLQARGCRVLLLPIIPSANTAEGDNWLARGPGTPYTAMEAANARTETMFPGLMARHADGRSLLKFLQDRNDGSPEALDDVAKGFTPRNLRLKSDGSYDLLHMYGDGAGDRAVADFVDSALQSQALPNAITQTTDFVITAIGAADQVPDVAIARIGRDPMAALSDQVATGVRLTSTELPLSISFGQAFLGANMIAGPAGAGNHVGFTLAAGQTGYQTYVTPRIALSAKQRAALTGRTIRVKAVATLSVGFADDRKLNVSPVNATTPAGVVRQSVGTLVRNEVIGRTLYREATYVVQGDEMYIAPVFQIAASSGTNNDHSLQVTSVTFGIEAVPAGGTTTANDEQLGLRLDDFWSGKGVDAQLAATTSAVAANTTAVAGAAIGAASAKLTAGEQTLTFSVGQAFAGGTLIVGPSGAPNYIGFTVPAGSIGGNTYVSPRIALTPTQRASLTGRTIRLKGAAAVTSGFLGDRVLSANTVNVTTTAGVTRQNVGTLVRNETAGGTLYREATYVVQGDEAYITLVFQLAGSSSSGSHSLQVTSVTYALESVAAGKSTTVNDEQLSQALDQYISALGLSGLSAAVAGKRFGFINRLSDLTPSPQYFSGAVARQGADGRNWGWTVPAGSTGTTTLMQFSLPLQGLGSMLAGRRIRVTIGMDTSDNYAQFGGGVVQVVRPSGDVNIATTTISNTQVSTNRRVWIFEATLDGTETALKPFFSRGSQAAAAADQYVVVTDITKEIVSTPSDTISLLEENLRLGYSLRALAERALITTAYSAAISAATAGGSGYFGTKTVKADGTGDFAHPKDAVASILDAASTKRYRILIYPGNYSGQHSWVCKDYVDLVGIDRATCIISYENPDNVDPASTANFQTLWCNTETRLENLTITIRNGRYPVHSDSSGALVDRTIRVLNCHIEHLGNDGARSYQASIGGTVPVWASEHAWGYGSSSGMNVIMDRATTLKSKVSALYVHTRENFSKPSVTDVRNIRAIVTNDTGTALTVQPLGSGQNDMVLLNNTEFVGRFAYQAWPWIQTTLAYQPANHAEVTVVGAGNSPMAFTVIDFGRALKIESADTSNASAVTVTGSAVPVIMGDVVSKPGSGGLKGYVYGKFDISGTGVGLASNVFITSLGKRLGDCSAAPKTLTIAFQGGAAVDVVFNTNLTDATNASILATIQAAIGAAGTVSAYAIGERYRPSLLDEEKLLRNSTAVGIPMGSVLAYDYNERTIRLMTSADAASRFAGVAWEDIYPGQSGRVKTRGYLAIGDVLRSDAAAFNFADTFSIDAAAPGRVVKGGNQGLLSAIRSDAVRVA